MGDMSRLVKSEQMASQHRLCLRIETGKEIETSIAQQNPVKEYDIEGFEQKQHGHEPECKLPETKFAPDSVPCA